MPHIVTLLRFESLLQSFSLFFFLPEWLKEVIQPLSLFPLCFKLGIINLLQEFAMVLCEKAFINAIKHLLFCCYWCNGKSMTDVTYGQFFWALSLPFILEKKEVLTFMLFLQGCWMRGKKNDICERILWSTKCHIAFITTARQTCLWCLSWTVFIRGCQLQGNKAFLFLFHTWSPRTKHCAWYTIGAGWISQGRIAHLATEVEISLPTRKTFRVSCYSFLWKHNGTIARATKIENEIIWVKHFLCD